MSTKRHKKSRKSRSTSSSIISYQSSSDGSPLNEDGPKFSVEISKIMGRFMVATKDIQPGEKIISELPIVVGPCTDCKVQCLGCYKNLEEEEYLVRCENCGWPICSQTCSGLQQSLGHSETECAILKKTRSSRLLNYDNLPTVRSHFQAIVPLRCLLLKQHESFNIIWNMEHHNAKRKNIPEVWNGNQVNVVDRIIKDWGLHQFTEDEIHSICGILEVNCFEIGQNGVNIRGLYPTAFLMSHDCVPNTNHIDEEYRLTVRASTRIRTGQPITLSYAYTLQNTLKRRDHLLDNKFFECSCQRCSDPSELGSYSGALVCPKCTNGLVLCDNPLDFYSTWSCNNSRKQCPGYRVTTRSMRLLLNRISSEADEIDCNDINTMEKFLHKYRNVLHPTHYLFLGVKISLSQLYGKIEGYLIHELDNDTLERKLELCKELLDIFDIIEPGYTRIRGITLYEIHAPMMMLLTRQLAELSLSKSEIKGTLRKILVYLKEASTILGYEPENSPERLMGAAAEQALLQIKDWEKIVGKF